VWCPSVPFCAEKFRGVPWSVVLFLTVPLKVFMASHGLGMASPWSIYGVPWEFVRMIEGFVNSDENFG